MDGSERISIGSAGVFDVGLLEESPGKPDGVTIADFSFTKFIARTAEWGPLIPRPKIDYSVSPQIKIEEHAEALKNFSVCKIMNDGKKRTLQDIIRDYILNLDSNAKNMFCIHSKEYPHFYYARTILTLVHESVFRPRKPFPIVLVITRDEESRKAATRSLFNQRSREKKARLRGWIREIGREDQPAITSVLLENGRERRPTTDLLVGTSSDVYNYMKTVETNTESDSLQLSVKYVIVIGAEKLSSDETFRKNVSEVAACLKTMSSVIFFHNFIESTVSVLESMKTCRKMVSREMFVEVERQGIENIYDRIKFIRTVEKAEFADLLVAEKLINGKTVPTSVYERYTVASTVPVQKVRYCISCIHNLRKEREAVNNQKHQVRRERILVITKSANETIFVYWYLRRHSEELGKISERSIRSSLLFNVNIITENDPIEHVETRNLEFRWSELDVLVIDWRSIQSVNRGTVDAVILYDPPEQRYFQTMIEAEIANLKSYRSPMFIKLYIMFDVEEDLKLMGQYLRLLQKYGKGAPAWFPKFYQIYTAQWHEKHGKTKVPSSSTSSLEVVQRVEVH